MNDKLPAGYADFVTPDGHCIAVPQAVWWVLRQERDARRALEFEAERAAQAEHAAKTADTDLKPEPGNPPALPPSNPPPGYHRVLPALAELLARVDNDSARHMSTPDRDVRERQALICKQLRELGPDRCVGRPEGWRAALDTLERDMPNFIEPIRLVRHTLSLMESTATAIRIPPMLLLGPPGVGKSYFSQRLAELLRVPHATLAFDQPSASGQLRGSDSHWSNTKAGLLFNLLCLGDMANPVILLDEIDKASADSGHGAAEPLAQLHTVLEPQTARRTEDISTHVVFDASLVGYIATANSVHGIGVPLLSRFEIFQIGLPGMDESVEVARRVIAGVIERLKLQGQVSFERRCAYVLGRMSPRLMRRTAERLVAAAMHEGRAVITEEQVWAELGLSDGPRLH